MISPEGAKMWVHFCYERLPLFCFRCGVLGHELKTCCNTLDTEGGKLQYGDWLRAKRGGKRMGERRTLFHSPSSGGGVVGAMSQKSSKEEAVG
jgi:hypothetical protein